MTCSIQCAWSAFLVQHIKNAHNRVNEGIAVTINTTSVTVKYLGVTITSDLKWSTHITNTCKLAKQKLELLYRQLSADWPENTITPVFKSWAESSVSNYRPISLLYTHSKLLEHIVVGSCTISSQTSSSPPDIMDSDQGSSTQEVLLQLEIRSQSNFSCLIPWYVQGIWQNPSPPPSPFSVSCQHPGPLLKWLERYLSNRSQKVHLNGYSFLFILVSHKGPFWALWYSSFTSTPWLNSTSPPGYLSCVMQVTFYCTDTSVQAIWLNHLPARCGSSIRLDHSWSSVRQRPHSWLSPGVIPNLSYHVPAAGQP